MLTISYKNLARFACFLTAATLALIGAGMWNAARAESYQNRLENNAVFALTEAASGMNTLAVDLKKSSYAGTPAQIAGISAKILKESGEVKSALERLPSGAARLDGAYRFLSQVGDYSMYLSGRAVNGLTLTDEDRDNVERLMEYSELLSENLRELERMVSSGELEAGIFIEADGELPIRQVSTEGFASVEKSFESYPKLIYDGPFSDHLMEKTSDMTRDIPKISREAAREIAGEYAGVNPENLLGGGDEASNMPSYTFCNDDVTVGVTMNGGFITYLLGSRMPEANKLSIDDGRRLAAKYLRDHGITSMTETYYDLAAGILTVNYAYKQGEVVCYTDLIKVGVAMDNGEVLFYDARGFINNHRIRRNLEPSIPPETAQKSLSAGLKAQDFRVALIPTAGSNETLTWEFLCKGRNGENVLVYINAHTGEEEQILILIESENGVLVA